MPDVAISCGNVPIRDPVPGDRHASLAMTQKYDGYAEGRWGLPRQCVHWLAMTSVFGSIWV